MDLSLVVCTRNRARQLSAALRSLAALRSTRPWELVLVDNGSTDETPHIIDRFRNHFGQAMVTLVHRRGGLGSARNAGWKAAAGEIIVFTDDDCYPAEDFLDAVALCFREDARLGFVGGRVLLFDPTDYPITIQESTVRTEVRPGDFLPAGLIHGANLAARRAALEAVGGFDSRFGAGSLFPCEDVDLLARISARGWHGAYDPRPVVYHHHCRKTCAEAERTMRHYDRGRGAYYTKCVLNPVLRKTYARHWYWRIQCQALGTTLRELAAGTEFLVRAAL
jgi:glycosyltransferase involved in cell wall biosynthesis